MRRRVRRVQADFPTSFLKAKAKVSCIVNELQVTGVSLRSRSVRFGAQYYPNNRKCKWFSNIFCHRFAPSPQTTTNIFRVRAAGGVCYRGTNTVSTYRWLNAVCRAWPTFGDHFPIRAMLVLSNLGGRHVSASGSVTAKRQLVAQYARLKVAFCRA